MAAPVKMDELLVTWLGSDEVYENVLDLIEKYRVQRKQQQQSDGNNGLSPPPSPKQGEEKDSEQSSPRGVTSIPPFYPLKTPTGNTIQRRRKLPRQAETWDPLPVDIAAAASVNSTSLYPDGGLQPSGMESNPPDDHAMMEHMLCVRDQVSRLLQELRIIPEMEENTTASVPQNVTLPLEVFVRITKEVCHFPSFFNGPLYQRIVDLWNKERPDESDQTDAVSFQSLEWFWKKEMEPFDPPERFFRLVKQPEQDCILRDDFLPYIKALLNDHPVCTDGDV
jgi:hypothetical protein